ncbi:MAG: tRNA (adenosine(37)-N6)-threonylcarbamoyltransferase complex transferase subunit TsaD [Spirochaetales bacterium]|nr:tRNA (adenosine(37)-N6)-threonylcarbamoyltransferase complex transferase subunit TsaD [Spirochaetales bacterium]
MKILGIETSCDECSASVVEDGKVICSNIIATQIAIHRPFYGVVPEIASRKHLEWITPVVMQALEEASCTLQDIDGVAATYRPGLIGSLLVGLSYAKGLAFTSQLPFIGVDHIEAHLYAVQLEQPLGYPFIGVLVSGGHTMIAVVNDFDDFEVLGTTIDDACGEAFDKVAKFYDYGYPGGVAIQKLAVNGNAKAFKFPHPSLHKGDHRYNVSYSGLKNAAINQLDLFWDKKSEKSAENIAASFQKTAIDILLSRVFRAAEDTNIKTAVFGGGVAANSYLREILKEHPDIKSVFPSLKLCTDNAAMVAGCAYQLFSRGERSSFSLRASARVPAFRWHKGKQ